MYVPRQIMKFITDI